MKYFIDTEFIEGFHKPLFGKKRHFIDLISIGIYAEDGREYYSISSEYKYSKADKWVKGHVIYPMYFDAVPAVMRHAFNRKTFHKWFGVKNKKIAQEIIDFIGQDDDVQFYGYFADYDWVLFCSLFGRMIDLPKGFPMYCVDLKQKLDEYARRLRLHGAVVNLPVTADATEFPGKRYYPATFKESLDFIKGWSHYPKQSNEHHALDDAKWNADLYNFLRSTVI